MNPGSYHVELRNELEQEKKFTAVYWVGLIGLVVVIAALLILI